MPFVIFGAFMLALSRFTYWDDSRAQQAFISVGVIVFGLALELLNFLFKQVA